ncbi:MAG: restriction endonuclease subunit S [Hornefia butyriciproducens]|uniref:restriction endonuclease subunit S n=1 Tax=Hornefia butyriciproducens TaxID=2652293 RepID=UPI002A75BE6F|nr:restriction endonuclease subunit S [Hornefia butyriciproducens]MDY2991548.1 restriction endonuclease subunit S [Hornefia butyriciproducens]
MPERKTPQVRFKGFTDAWEQRKLGDVADIVGGGTPSTENPEYWDGDIDWYAPAEIADQIYVKTSQRKITEQGYDNSSAKLLPPGTVLFTSRAGIGKTAILARKGCTNQGFQSIVPHKNELDTYFIFSRTEELKRYGELVGAGSTFVEVSGKQMAAMELMLPSTIREQQTIGAFFKKIDNLITLHQRECERLQMVKKSMLENCFPKNGEKVPRFRFAGFTGDWKQRKLGDIADVYDGVHQTPDYQESGIMFLSVENIATLTSNKFISEEAFQRDYKSYPVKGDILMTRIGDVGTPNVVESTEKVAFYVSLALIKPKSIDSYFLCNAIRSPRFQKALRDRTLVTAIPQKINKDEIGKVEFLMPSNINEQREIGAYFHNLDHLITLHQSELEMLKKIKESMLGKMLV